MRLADRPSSSVPSILYDEQYFLHVCEGHQEFRSSEGEYLSKRLAEALAVAGIAPGMRVLDVGCGRGEILRNTIALGARAYGIDYARRLCSYPAVALLGDDERAGDVPGVCAPPAVSSVRRVRSRVDARHRRTPLSCRAAIALREHAVC